MPEFYLSHQPRIIVAEIPTDEPPPEVASPLESEEWVSGWLITAPANPRSSQEIMEGLAQVANDLPPDTLLLYPYDATSLAHVLANWIRALETEPEMPVLLEEEVEDNVEAFRNLLLGEKTLWRAFKEVLGFLPLGHEPLAAIDGYEAVLERALVDFQEAAVRGPEALSPVDLHNFAKRARELLVGEKREALRRLVAAIAPETESLDQDGPRDPSEEDS